MKTYQKPTITNILLEDTSKASMQSTGLCIGRDARATGGMPCGSTTSPSGLTFTLTPITGCDGATIFPGPSFIQAVILDTTGGLETELRKGFSFPEVAATYADPAGCAGSTCTPQV